MGNAMRYFGCAVGFGFGAVWMSAGLGAAIVCLLLAALGYGVVFATERARVEASTRRSTGFERARTRENDPPDDASTPLAAETEYGWPATVTS
jgi:hypothetical protein